MKTLQKEKIEDHFENVFKSVNRGRSKLGERQEEIYSLSGIGMKHLLNILCDLSYKINYLELGPYRGGTLISALWENDVNAYVVDHFKWDATSPNRYQEDGHPNVRTALNNTIDTYKRAWKGKNTIKIIDSDLHEVDLSEIDTKIDVVFHDADKKGEDIEIFLKKYKSVLDKYCILAFTKMQDIGIKGKIENNLKDNNYNIIESRMIPDTGVGLDGRSGVGLYYIENKKIISTPTPKKVPVNA